MKVKLACLLFIYLFISCGEPLEGDKKNILNSSRMDRTCTSESSMRLSIEEIMKSIDQFPIEGFLVEKIPKIFKDHSVCNDSFYLNSFFEILAKLTYSIMEGFGRVINSLPPELIEIQQEDIRLTVNISAETFFQKSIPNFQDILINQPSLFFQMDKIILEKIRIKTEKLNNRISNFFSEIRSEDMEAVADELISNLNNQKKEFFDKLQSAGIEDLNANPIEISKENLVGVLNNKNNEELKNILGSPIQNLLEVLLKRELRILNEKTIYVKERLGYFKEPLSKNQDVLDLISQLESFSVFLQGIQMKEIEYNYKGYIRLKTSNKVLKEVLNNNTFSSLMQTKSTSSIGQVRERVRSASGDIMRIVRSASGNIDFGIRRRRVTDGSIDR